MSKAAKTVRTEASLPPVVSISPTSNLTDVVERNAVDIPDRAVYSRLVDGQWVDVTAAQFRQEVVGLAKGLVAAGVQSGDRIALLSRTRYEWTLFDFAIWYAGGVVVPVYPTSSRQQIELLLADSGAVAAVVETERNEAEVRQAMQRLPVLRHVWTIDTGCVEQLSSGGSLLGDDQIAARRTALTGDSLATIIYTSGTTGEPKGCMLTHGNFMFAVGTDVAILREVFGPDSSTLLFLPMAHVFARILEVACAIAQTRMGHAPSVRGLEEYLSSFQPTFLLAVPRVFENIFNNASQQAYADGRGRAFALATGTAIAYSQAVERGRLGPVLRARHALFDRIVYSQIRASLGGRVEHLISGGAPLGDRLGHFFRGCGLTVIEGYGLTETTAATTANRVETARIGTVGQPLPGTAVRIDDDGEVLLRGPHVFAGYYGRPDTTREAFDGEGWLRTGDLGDLDADGFLTISGRKKEIIVTTDGGNVAPAPLEDAVRAHPLVSQCMVVGDGRPYVTALITLEHRAVAKWAADHGKPGRLRDLVSDPDVRAEIQTAVDEANQTVPPAQSIRKFRLLSADWTEKSGHITPTLKLRRPSVMRDFRADVERLYY